MRFLLLQKNKFFEIFLLFEKLEIIMLHARKNFSPVFEEVLFADI